MLRHDSTYRRLFRHRPLIEDLLREVAPGPWLEKADFQSLEPLPARFVGPKLQQRESDAVWRLRVGGDHWCYVYVLVELQSTVDRFMALRVLAYVALLWQSIADHGGLTPEGLLPPVLPIVLYNGEERWWAPCEIEELIAESPPGLESFRPRLRYQLLDEVHAENESLDPESLVSAILRLEQSRTLDELRPALTRLLALLHREDNDPLRRDFGLWLRQVLVPTRFPKLDPGELKPFQEWTTMLEQRVQQWYLEAEERGLEKGREEGTLRGLARALERQLELKFGPLDDSTRRRLHEADAARIERWLANVLEADRLDAVWNG